MIRSFETNIASQYGINEAILIHNFYFWINKNATNGEHYYDGRYWTYNSVQALSAQSLCLSEEQVRHALKKLVDTGFLAKGNYNVSNLNRTSWYAFSDLACTVLCVNGYDMKAIAPDLGNFPNTNGENPKSQYTDIYTTDIKNNDKDKSLSKKGNDLFEECWKAYQRKGSKKVALTQWKKLKDEDHQKIKTHIPHYLSANERQYRKDFERYLRDRVFDTPVYGKGGQIIFDPETAGEYHPYGNNSIVWNDRLKHYVILAPPEWGVVDGYTDEDRPENATLLYQSIPYVWNKETKNWERK